MNTLWDYWIAGWRDNHGVSEINWKTTPGIGDSMYGLNIAFMRAFVNQKPTTFRIHYYFPENYYHHFEDPETVSERTKYVLDRYMWKDIVHVEHVYDCPLGDKLYRKRYNGVKRIPKSEMYRHWSFDPFIETVSMNKKIVIWSPIFNAETVMNGNKHCWNFDEWRRFISLLRDFDYKVVEIDYRTPISEAFYHIRTCECCISYEGMWHYIAKNFYKPHIVFSDAKITNWHTPGAIQLRSKEFYIDTDLHKVDYYIEAAQEKAYAWKKYFNRFVNGW